MNLLAIDASASVLETALFVKTGYLFSKTEDGKNSSSKIIDCIDSIVKEASLKPADLNGILCMGGPGSFTGLRIGFSVAKALAISISIPFVHIPTLECIAHSSGHPAERKVISVILSRKNFYFFALFQNGCRLTDDNEEPADKIEQMIRRYCAKNEEIFIIGPGAVSLFNTLPADIKEKADCNLEIRGYAKELISIAKSKNLFNNDTSAFLYSGPEYIRKTDAEINFELKDKGK